MTTVGYNDTNHDMTPAGALLEIQLSPEIAAIAAKNSPYSSEPGSDDFINQCAIWLPSRKLPYYKNTPGDCGTSAPLQTSAGGKIISLLPGTTGAAAAVAGSLGAVGVAGALGIATAGVGLLAAPIIAILQHHAVAVQQEQSTLCGVSIAFNQAILQIDAAVMSGSVTVAQGVAGVAAMAAQLKQAIDSVIKVQAGNSGDNYKHMLDAHADFAGVYYPIISPLAATTNPGNPSLTGAAGLVSPASSALSAFTSALGVGSTAGLTVGGISGTTLLLIGAAIVILFLLSQRR